MTMSEVQFPSAELAASLAANPSLTDALAIAILADTHYKRCTGATHPAPGPSCPLFQEWVKRRVAPDAAPYQLP